jgi:hypothetical protein
LVEVALYLLEVGGVFHVLEVIFEVSHFVFDDLLVLLELIESFRAGVGVVVGLEYFLDLVEQFIGHSLTVFAVGALDLLQLSQFVRDVFDVLLVLLVDGLHVLQSALLLVVDDVVLRLQLLHLVCDLQLQC